MIKIAFAPAARVVKMCVLLVVLVGLQPAYGQGVLRVGSWNVANRPNTTADELDFGTVLTGIGNQSVNGNVGRLGILAMQETDSSSAADLRDVFNTAYGVDSYEVIFSTPDGGSDRTGFVYDTSQVSLSSQTELEVGLTHHALRATFQPLQLIAAEPLTVYSIHLKSGTSSANELERATEANVIRADADALPEGSSILYAGDFNMLTSSEEAWANIVAPGNGQAFDVANAPGDWRGNSEFIALHTQNPQSRTDDRFDLHFASTELTDGAGLEYVADSFSIFGNNGSHTLDQPITTGNWDSSELTALVNVSDHLPIFSDYVYVPLPGDFNFDGLVDFQDVDAYIGQFGLTDTAPTFNTLLDLNSDGTITVADHDLHITTLLPDANGTGSLIGDLNRDGDVDVSQFESGTFINVGDASILLNSLGTTSGALYGNGDLNGDGDVDISQFDPATFTNLGDASRLLANLGKTTTGSVGNAFASVPEPGCTGLCGATAIVFLGRRKRRP